VKPEVLLALSNSLARLAPISNEALQAMAALLRPRSFDRNQYLLKGNERAEWVFLIVRGLVRELYITDDGAEHTRAFIAEGQSSGSLLDLLSGAPSVTWIQALEPTETLAWRYADFDALCQKIPSLQLLARRAAEALYVRKARREYEMLALPAEQRYQRWQADHPQLDERITRRHLASYLGVTPEHLSRLSRRNRASPAAKRDQPSARPTRR
jgi:CRP-like cAMP-binding protein